MREQDIKGRLSRDSSDLVPHAEVLGLDGVPEGQALPAGPDAAAVLALAVLVLAVLQSARIPFKEATLLIPFYFAQQIFMLTSRCIF